MALNAFLTFQRLTMSRDTDRGGAIPIPDRNTDWRDDSFPVRTYTNMSGPLMTSVLALFGPESWLNGLANLTSARDEDRDTLETMYADRPALLASLCNATPFGHFRSSAGNTYAHAGCTESMFRLMMTYSDYMSGWSRNATAADRLGTAMTLANQAALTSHTLGLLPWARDTGREIYTAPGIRVWKPEVGLASLIILSVIVGLQILGLVALGWWIFMWPTWTRTLDARAIARVAASLDPGLLPPVGTSGQKEWERLAHVDGIVGAQLQEHAVEQQQQQGSGGVVSGSHTDGEIEMRALSVASTVGKEPTSEVVPASAANESTVSLALGARGLVSRRWGKRAQPMPSVDHTYA
ncbi:hypothetical protein N0V86_009382 [Didymella sp. IMI 355093]|nr:hypothetical protein N0V86_009382 [Didymella sp. IMI 355093]